MNIKEFVVSKQVIIPKGQFDNVKVMMSITYEHDGFDMDYEHAWNELNQELRKEVARVSSSITPTQPSQALMPVESICPTHHVAYDKSGVSAKTNKPWSMHKLADGTACWKK